MYRYHNDTWSESTLENEVCSESNKESSESTKVDVSIGSTKRSNFVWPDSGNSGIVYLLDLSIGLYRSIDGGKNWNNIWPCMTFNNKDFFNTGYIAADNNNPTTLYLSVQGKAGSPIGTQFKVFRIVVADHTIDGDFGEPGHAVITDITNHSNGTRISRPGPLAFDVYGHLWLTEQQDAKNSVEAGFYVMENPMSDTSFTDMTTNDYRNAVVSPTGIAISSDGHAYVTQNGGGVNKLSLPCRFGSSC